MKTTGFILFILVFIGTSTYFASERDIPPPESSSYLDSVKNKKLADLIQENQNLKIKIKALEDSNQNLLASIRTHKQTSPSSTAPILSDSNTAQLEQDFSEELRIQRLAEENARGFTAYLRSFGSNSEKDFNQDLTKKFEAEPVDFAWAQDHEAKLGHLFVTQENLSKFVPEHIICRTTRCQIKMPISSIEESNQVMEGLSQAFTDKSLGLGESRILTLPDPSSGFVDFYIARDKDITLYQ